MKHIKTFNEMFNVKKENPPLEVMADMNTFNDTEKWIKDFNARKSALNTIYTTYKDDTNSTDGMSIDLYNKLISAKFIKPSNPKTKIVFINPFFTLYSEICKKNREITNINSTITQKQTDIQAKQKAISDGTGDAKTNKIDLDTITTDINTNMEKLKQLNKDINILKSSSTNEISLKQKELNTSEKRINNEIKK